MIYIQIKELIKVKKAQWGRKITLSEIAVATGISRMTLFRMINNKGYNTVTDHLDKLCAFFECEIHELVKYVPNQFAPNTGSY
ncbi:MAG: helix-turn-helix domain-containing protein [Methylophilus sp.]